jgi:hypothetical protein
LTLPLHPSTLPCMSSFAYLIGKRVEVSYRAADIHLSITATLAHDSGEHIHLEDRFVQSGRENTLRISIPYSALLRIREVLRPPEPAPVA